MRASPRAAAEPGRRSVRTGIRAQDSRAPLLRTRAGCRGWRRGAPLCPKAGPFANSGRPRAPPGPPRLPNSALWPPARPPLPRLTAAGAGVHPLPGPRRRIPKPCPGRLWPAFGEPTRDCGNAHAAQLRGAPKASSSFLSFLSLAPRTPPLKIRVVSVIKCLIPSSTLSLHRCIIRSGKACFQANRPNKCYYWDSASRGCTIVTSVLANLV